MSESQQVPKTHDIRRLVQQASSAQSSFSAFLTDADVLTPLATEFRYPSDDEAPMPTVQQADEAIAASRRIYDFVLSLLPSETQPV